MADDFQVVDIPKAYSGTKKGTGKWCKVAKVLMADMTKAVIVPLNGNTVVNLRASAYTCIRREVGDAFSIHSRAVDGGVALWLEKRS